MSTHVFISHSSKDGEIAQTICRALENRGVSCWIASRDVAPGDDFMAAIVRAIRKARVMILVFTSNANNSDEIKRELVLASQHKLVIIPVRLEDVVPNDAFEYAFATRQWIDLFNDWERSIQQLIGRIAEFVPLHAAAGQAIEPQPSEEGNIASPLMRFATSLNEVPRNIWIVGFSVGVACVAAICSFALAINGDVRAAAIILEAIFVAGLLTTISAPFAAHRNTTVRLAGRSAAWIVSLLFISFLTFVAIGFVLHLPAVDLMLGLSDEELCAQPSERPQAFSCGPTDNGRIVIGIRFKDADRGLNMRDRPTTQGIIRSTLPPNATEVVLTGECEAGWCPVQCANLRATGWSQGRYLAPRAETLNAVTGSDTREPRGLAVRSGPHESCRQTGTLPYESRDVILHICEASPVSGSEQQWCRITYKDQSGWIVRGFLESQR